jgi:hypothetical protein
MNIDIDKNRQVFYSFCFLFNIPLVIYLLLLFHPFGKSGHVWNFLLRINHDLSSFNKEEPILYMGINTIISLGAVFFNSIILKTGPSSFLLRALIMILYILNILLAILFFIVFILQILDGGKRSPTPFST